MWSYAKTWRYCNYAGSISPQLRQYLVNNISIWKKQMKNSFPGLLGCRMTNIISGLHVNWEIYLQNSEMDAVWLDARLWVWLLFCLMKENEWLWKQQKWLTALALSLCSLNNCASKSPFRALFFFCLCLPLLTSAGLLSQAPSFNVRQCCGGPLYVPVLPLPCPRGTHLGGGRPLFKITVLEGGTFNFGSGLFFFGKLMKILSLPLQ